MIDVLVTMVLAGVGTFLLRISMVLAGRRFSATRWIERRMGLIGPAALAALVASSIFIDAGSRTMPGIVEAAAVGLGFVAVRRTENIGAALVVGLPVYWVGVALGFS